MVLPQTVMLQLLLVRSLLARASEALENGSDTELMSAMLLLDIACETITKAAHTQTGATHPKQDSIALWVQELAVKSPGVTGIDAGIAARLRMARNPVQHSATVLAQTAVRAWRSDAERFITLVAKEAFGIDFAAISVLDLVTDVRIKGLLSEAVAARKDGRFDEGLVNACCAYGVLFTVWMNAIRRAAGLEKDGSQWGTGALHSLMARVSHRDVRVRFTWGSDTPRTEEVPGAVGFMTLGFTIGELLRIERCAVKADNLVNPSRRHGNETEPRKPVPATGEEIDFVVEAVARVAWRLESQHSDAFDLQP